MRPAKLSSLCILALSLSAPALWAAGQQKSKPDKPLEEWQQSWSKFKEHIVESHKVDGGGIPVVTNGSVELLLALADGPIAPSELTGAAKRTGLGKEVKFTAIFKGTEALSENQKKRYGSSVTLKFEDPFDGYFFSDPNEKEVSKWKNITPGSKVRWRATVSAIALWPIRPDKPIYLIALRDAKIIDLDQAPTSPPPAPNPVAAEDRATASSEDWKRDPTAFVHLLIDDDLSLHPSAAGTSSVSVPHAVRQPQ